MLLNQEDIIIKIANKLWSVNYISSCFHRNWKNPKLKKYLNEIHDYSCYRCKGYALYVIMDPVIPDYVKSEFYTGIGTDQISDL